MTFGVWNMGGSCTLDRYKPNKSLFSWSVLVNVRIFRWWWVLFLLCRWKNTSLSQKSINPVHSSFWNEWDRMYLWSPKWTGQRRNHVTMKQLFSVSSTPSCLLLHSMFIVILFIVIFCFGFFYFYILLLRVLSFQFSLYDEHMAKLTIKLTDFEKNKHYYGLFIY